MDSPETIGQLQFALHDGPDCTTKDMNQALFRNGRTPLPCSSVLAIAWGIFVTIRHYLMRLKESLDEFFEKAFIASELIAGPVRKIKANCRRTSCNPQGNDSKLR